MWWQQQGHGKAKAAVVPCGREACGGGRCPNRVAGYSSARARQCGSGRWCEASWEGWREGVVGRPGGARAVTPLSERGVRVRVVWGMPLGSEV